MTKTDIQKELDSNIPKDVVSTREGGGGKSLSYLETWYVIDRLNQVVGQGNWGYSIAELTKVFEGEVEQYSGKVFATSYIATVTLRVDTVPTGATGGTTFTEVGYGDGTDKKSPGKAHELATKEAVSDALKRAAKNLGRSMGLALYDKTQEFVDKIEVPVKNSVGTGAARKQDVDATLSATGNGKGDTNAKGPYNTSKPGQSIAGPETRPSSGLSGQVAAPSKPIKELITSAFKVLEAQKKITAAEFKTKYQKGAGLSTLSEPTLQFILNSLKTDFPNLGL